MKQKNLLAGCGALLALALVPASVASAGTAAPVTVRVEGLKRELLGPTVARIHAGSVTRFGAPSGKCPDDSAAGALDAATRHSWKGVWESSFNDYEVTSIDGETHTFSSKDFWEIFVNGVAAQTGACEITVKPGEQLLFAAVPVKGAAERPLVIQDYPRNATAGKAFGLRVFAYTDKGRTAPVAGAEISGDGVHARTNRSGVAQITPTKPGNLVVRAAKSGLIRSAAVTIHVS